MKFEKIHNKGQARLFENPVLEKLTKGDPLVIWGMYIPALSYMMYVGANSFALSPRTVLAVFFAGMFFWTFFEYMIHRYAFHLLTDNPKLQRITYLLHGNHHHYPRDRERLFMPPLPSLIISSAIFGTMYLLMGIYALVFFPGFLLGYLLYGSMHYAIHAWNPPFKWLKPLWRNHHLHHYKDENHGFGVSSTLWDHIFGTMFDLRKEEEDKEKVRQLMFERVEERSAV